MSQTGSADLSRLILLVLAVTAFRGDATPSTPSAQSVPAPACGAPVVVSSPTAPWPPGPEAPQCARYVDVWVGAATACATCEDGRVTCWGELADGEWKGRIAPPHATTAYHVTNAIAASDRCVVGRDGRVTCFDLVGPPSVEGDREEIALPSRVVALGTGSEHACALLDDQQVACWGANEYEQLGPRKRGAPAFEPRPVIVPDLRAERLAVSDDTTCAIDTGHRAWCWGRTKTSTNWETGRLRVGPFEDVVRIATNGGLRICVQRRSGDVWCSQGTDTPRLELVGHFPPSRVLAVDGEGVRVLGEDGVVTEARGDQPPAALRGLPPVRALASGDRGTCAVLEHGELRCWGGNEGGALVLGATCARAGDATGPKLVTTPPASCARYASVWVGDRTSCAVCEDGGVTCRTGDTATALRGVTNAVAASDECVLRVDGVVACFANDSYAMLGIGDGSPPEPIVLPARATALVTGSVHACALLETHGVACWGRNPFQQLGTDEHRATDAYRQPFAPQVVPGLRAVQLAAAGSSTCAIDTGGRAWCWGRLWTSNGVPSPVQIGSFDDVVRIVVSGDVAPWGVCLQRRDGDVWCALRASEHDEPEPGFIARFPPSRALAIDDEGFDEWRVRALGVDGVVSEWDERAGLHVLTDLPPARDLASFAGQRTCVVLERGELRCWH